VVDGRTEDVFRPRDLPDRTFTHGRPDRAGGKEIEMNEYRVVPLGEDPVCGMTVEPDAARAKGLASTFEGTEYVFCGKGCLLEFRDAPDTYLAPEYIAAM
jgi:YHS domain-containing protein